jgi:hypothetical protein
MKNIVFFYTVELDFMFYMKHLPKNKKEVGKTVFETFRLEPDG